jgi:hypothetical protein
VGEALCGRWAGVATDCWAYEGEEKKSRELVRKKKNVLTLENFIYIYSACEA